MILPDNTPLETLAPGAYVVRNPATGLDAGTYLIEVFGSRAADGKPVNLQTAFRRDDGAEFFRGNLSASTADWTDWQPRSGSGSEITASAIVDKLDTLFGSTAWRDGTHLSVTNHGVDSLDIASSTGDDITLPSATPDTAGLMGAVDKTRLDFLGWQDVVREVPFYAAAPVPADALVVIDDDLRIRPFDLGSIVTDANLVICKSRNAAAPGERVFLKVLSA